MYNVYVYVYVYVHVCVCVCVLYIYIYVYIVYVKCICICICICICTCTCMCMCICICKCICICISMYMYIDGAPPRPTFPANSMIFTVVSSHFELLKFRAVFCDESLPYLPSLFPSYLSLSTSDSRFKIKKKMNLEF